MLEAAFMHLAKKISQPVKGLDKTYEFIKKNKIKINGAASSEHTVSFLLLNAASN